MAYSKTTWVNNSTPALNAANLNNMETGIDEAHDCANITNTPAGNIAATDVQTAINELDTEKENTLTAHHARHVTGGGDVIADAIAAGNSGLMSGADKTKIDGVEAAADVTDTANVTSAGALMETTYNAQSVVIAITDDTPIALGVAASEIVGRTAGGNIDSLTATEARTVLNVEDAADVTDATNVAAAGAVMDADFTAAEEIMVGTGIGTHGQVTLAASEFVAKKAAGAVTNVSATDARTILNVENGATADQTNAEIRTAVEAATDSNVFTDTDHTKLNGIATAATKYPDTGEQAFLDADHTKLNGIDTGADVTGSNPPQSHGHAYHTDRTRELFLTDWYNKSNTTDYDYGLNYPTGVQGAAHYGFKIPTDFVSISNVYVYYYMSATGGNILLTVSGLYGALGETHNTHYDNDAANVISASTVNIARFQTSGILTSVASGDMGRIYVLRDGTDGSDTAGGNMYVKGIAIEYTADM